MKQKADIINIVNKYYEHDDNAYVYKAEKLLEEYVEKNPNDIDMLLRLALFELRVPICDNYRSIDYIRRVFDLDPYNFDAAILFAYANNFFSPYFDDDVLERLSGIKTDDPEKLSMMEYVKSWSYNRIEEDEYRKLHGDSDGFYTSPENYTQYENALKKSIELYPYHVCNYKYLALLYGMTGKKNIAAELLRKAISNVKEIYRPNDDYNTDWTSVQEHFDEMVKGTSITLSNYESLEDNLKEYSQS